MSEWETCYRYAKSAITARGTIYVRRPVHGHQQTVAICPACYRREDPHHQPQYVC